MARTLITGATGFIGCRLAERWQSNGESVRAIGMQRNDVESKRLEGLRRAGVDCAVGDLLDARNTDAVLDDVDTVIHLAAAQHEANVDDDYFIKVNVGATRDLLSRCEKHGVKRFFYASSIGVYGIQNNAPIDDSTATAPDNAYGRSKVAAEKMLREYTGTVSVFIGRIGETYGPWDMRLHKLYAGIRKKRFWLVGPSKNLHQPVYVDDLADAIMQQLATPSLAGVPIILCGDRPITTEDMCKSIAASLGEPLSALRIPMWPFLVAAVGMEMTLGKVGIQPPLHRRRLDFFRKSLSFSAAARERLPALPPQISFADGARRTADWYRSNGWL
jgi:nucleoside-diphosphate-sugar epimerase